MPIPQSYNGQVPLGKIAITAAGTTSLLSTNCGPFGGNVGGTALQPAVPGTAAQYFLILADQNNSGNLYLLPRGKTATGNPTSIMAIIPPGGSIPFPFSGDAGPGLQPENFCLDTDAGSGTQYAYGYATMRG
jgi:hypothetical protein